MTSRSALELVINQHKLASECARRELDVDFAPARELARACNAIFSLVDRNDDHQRDMARLVWRLKSTVLQTLLPFDDERLDVRSMVAQLAKTAEAMPSMAAAARSIVEIVGVLLARPGNPKLERVTAVLSGSSENGIQAIFAGLQGAASPGWPSDIDPARDLCLPQVRVLRSRRDLQDRVFSRLVIPGTLRFAARPLVRDLLHGGRARDVVITAYRGERVHVPEPIALPRDMTFASAQGHRPAPSIVAEEPADEGLDKWVNESFWEGIRAQQPDMTPTSDRDVPVSARYVLFADASGAFLPADRTVIEVSDLLDRREGLNADADHMPRKAVSDLEERDLILLRLSGSGDYVDDVADALMTREGRAELRHEATQWKSMLLASLKAHGEGVVARTFRERGGRLRSPGYLWVWAGEAVIAPQSLDTFRLLIATLCRLDVTHPIDPDAYASARWEQMEVVKDYHRRAGGEIRAALLERVRRLIAERARIDTVESIDLPGVRSGRMGLMRISAVDAQSVRVPYSRLFHLHRVKVT